MTVVSGQAVVSTAGTAVQLGDQPVNASLAVRALPGNTGVVYLGNAGGDVDSSNGLALGAGEGVVLAFVSNLNQLYLDAATGGDGVSWLILWV